jgi:hypothetical protein
VPVVSEEKIFNYWYLKFQRRRYSIIGAYYRGEDIQLLVLVVSEEKIFNYWYLKFQRRRYSIIGT